MLFLKKAGEELLAKQSVVSLLMSSLAGPKPSRSHTTIHVSDLTKPKGFCPREYSLLHSTETTLPDVYVSAATQVAFDNGNALHHLCRDKWLRRHVVGDWECNHCHHIYRFSKVPFKCSMCGHSNFEYREVVFMDPVSKAEGSIDFFVDFGHGTFVMCEVKSIDKDSFAALMAPLGEHRIRTQLYLELMRRSWAHDGVDLSYGLVLYISKGFGKRSEEFGTILPFKEFRIPAHKVAADPYFSKAEEVTKFLKGGVLPRGVCSSPLMKRAKECSVCTPCWSGGYGSKKD